MRRYLLLLTLLFLAAGVTLQAFAADQGADYYKDRGTRALENLKSALGMFDTARPVAHAGDLIRAQKEAESVKEEIDTALESSEELSKDAVLKGLPGKLKASIDEAADHLTPEKLLEAVTTATAELEAAATKIDQLFAEEVGSSDSFISRHTRILAAGVTADRLVERYTPLKELVFESGLSQGNVTHHNAVKLLGEALDTAKLAGKRARNETAGDRSRYVTRIVRLYFFQNSEHMLRNLISPDREIYQMNAERIKTLEQEVAQARKDATVAAAEFTRLQAQRIADNDALQRAKVALEEAERRLAEAKQAEADAKQKETDAEALVAKRLEEKQKAEEAVNAADSEVMRLESERAAAEKEITEQDPEDKEQIRLLDEQLKMVEDKLKTEKDPAARRQLIMDRMSLISERRKVVAEIEGRQSKLRSLEKQKREAELKKKNGQTELATATQRHKDAQDAHGRAVKARESAEGAVKTADGEVGEVRETVSQKNESLDKALTNAVVASRNANQKAAELADTKADFRSSPSPWVAREIPASTDPLDRVRIQADAGSTLILRGNPDDVEKAIRVIKDRDRPGAQVRAVFWTIQVNGADTPKHSRTLERAIADINREMAIVRGQIAVTGATLREAILTEYHAEQGRQCATCRKEAKSRKCEKCSQGGKKPEGSPDCEDCLRKATEELAAGHDHTKLEYVLFTRKMQNLLNLRNDFRSQFPLNTRLNLHPLNLSTYGEAVAVFALMDRKHQESVLKDFQCRLPRRLAEMEVTYLRQGDRIGSDDIPERRTERIRYYEDICKFVRVKNHFYFGDDLVRSTTLGLAPTPTQREIDMFLESMNKHVWLKTDRDLLLIDRMRTSANWDRANDDDKRAINRLLGRPDEDSSPPDSTGLSDAKKALEKQAESFKLDGLYTDTSSTASSPGDTTREVLRMRIRREYRAQMGDGGALDRRARVAAMDALIRRVMQATEDDIDLQFVQPALKRIRKAAAARGVTLGSIERNGVIAMNRTPARVDPHATFEIQLPPKVNFLKEVRNAASLAVAVQSGAFMGLLDQLEKTRPSSLDDMPGTYFVENGNELEFTPVVGPDGQAIRMGVRFRRYSPVRLPNRERGQNFGKVERHNVDTDVQDTNFELLEIARFENQTTIGENRQRQGGIPILNQIPGIREIPFIGYFTRERERVIGNQESLIFMQTAIYPSIEDLIGLFAESEVTNPN